MTDSLHFANSPLTEALIDIQVELKEDFPLTELADLRIGNEKLYPEQRDRIFFEGQVHIEARTPTAVTSQTQIGYDFISADERQVVQVRRNGFTFSRLKPYESWETFVAEARRWWKLYAAKTEPLVIKRLAVRYVNRLNIPSPIVDLKDYLRTSPEVSPDLPQGLSGYFMQLHLPQEDIEGMLILNEALALPSDPGTVSVLLDIDLFRETNVPSSDEAIWEYFDQLRDRKNTIFLACITDLTKELIA